VRSGGDFTDHFMSETDWQLYGACAHASMPSRADLAATAAQAQSMTRPLTNSPDFSAVARAAFSRAFSDYSHPSGGDEEEGFELAFFVATDTEKGRVEASRVLGNFRATSSEKHHGAKTPVLFGPGEFLRSDHPQGVRMALLDVLLLASAADRVTTAWSTFGYFAAAFAGPPANMVVDQSPTDVLRLEDDASRRGQPSGSGRRLEDTRYMGVPHKSDKRRQCVRLPTQQPCFHKFATWGGLGVSCAKLHEWTDEEMRRGRYC
jgi:hypothetical protein